MKNSTKFILIILWIIILYALGIYYFQKGFLLSRSVVPLNSSCEEKPIILSNTTSDTYECWFPPIYKKVVIIIIDALRFDFAAKIPQDKQKTYHNRLKTIANLLENSGNNSRLYHFWADPPSTTLQRLKGLYIFTF